MDAKQFAWLYLIENGIAGLEPSFYGGYDPTPDLRKDFAQLKSCGDQYNNPFKERFLKEIKAYGVDWDKTEAPESTSVSRFQGTFSDSSETEMIKGVLVLGNGKNQQWIGDSIKVSNVFEMMAMVDSARERFKEIFG